MSRTELLKKLGFAVDDAIRTRMYGELQIEFRGGEPTFLRKTTHEKLDSETENRKWPHLPQQSTP